MQIDWNTSQQVVQDQEPSVQGVAVKRQGTLAALQVIGFRRGQEGAGKGQVTLSLAHIPAYLALVLLLPLWK